jgi:hypothetical protein
MDNMITRAMRHQGFLINTPNPKCEDKCANAKQALLFIANNTQTELDITKIIIVCGKCQSSFWSILKKKEMGE